MEVKEVTTPLANLEYFMPGVVKTSEHSRLLWLYLSSFANVLNFH
jgi:hypothetical protein